jgi:hypothetical protein
MVVLTPALCGDEFVARMKNDTAAGENAEDERVRPNLVALGAAVHNIVKQRAEFVSDPTSDAAFWAWVAAVDAYLRALSLWQQAVGASFPSVPSPGVYPPVTPAPVPAELKVRVK